MITSALPPALRSAAARPLTTCAITGRFALQRCAECGTLQYPPADACRACVGVALPWEDQHPSGRLCATTEIHHPIEPYFRQRTPCRIGLVRIDKAPTILAHLPLPCPIGSIVHLSPRLDESGAPVLLALPPNAEPDPEGFSTIENGICILRTRDIDSALATVIAALDQHEIRIETMAAGTWIRGGHREAPWTLLLHRHEALE